MLGGITYLEITSINSDGLVSALPRTILNGYVTILEGQVGLDVAAVALSYQRALNTIEAT